MEDITENNNCDCIIEELLIKPFSQRISSKKMEMKNMIRPTPLMPNLKNVRNTKSGNKESVRNFHSGTYQRYEYITGCKKLNKLFCWPCLLFPQERNMWNSVGYSDLSHLSDSYTKHLRSSSHIECLYNFKMYEKTRSTEDLLLDKQKQIAVNKHNEIVKKNRDIMRRLIDTVCFLGQQEFPSRGHDDSEDYANRGNYRECLNFLSKYDSILANHLEDSTVFHGISSIIQDEIVKAVSTLILNSIFSEINNAKFVSILIDETSDQSNKSQLSTMIRYVSIQGKIEERFLFFSDVTSYRGVESLAQHVIKVINDLNCANKIICQAYDGAAVMAGHLSDTQAKVKQVFPNAKLLHCATHKLTLILQDALKFNPKCRRFFERLSGMANFLFQSSNRCALLKVIDNMKNYRDGLIEYFQKIINYEDESSENFSWDSNTLNLAQGYLQFLNDFESQFLTQIFAKIFSFSDALYNVFETKALDVTYCIKFLEETKLNILNLREDFDSFFDETNKLEGIVSCFAVCEDIKEKVDYQRFFNEIIDIIITQINTRFADLKDLMFVELLDSKKFQEFSKTLPATLLDELKTSYSDFFNIPSLKNELVVFYRHTDFHDISIQQIYQKILEDDLNTVFPETCKLCELILAIPFTPASVEKSFSTLKRIKTYSRNSMRQHRLAELAILSIEKKYLHKLQSEESFYENVIKNFVAKQKGIELIYK